MAFFNEPQPQNLPEQSLDNIEDDSPTQVYIVPTPEQIEAWIAEIEEQENSASSKNHQPNEKPPKTTEPEIDNPPSITPDMKFDIFYYKPFLKQVEEKCLHEQIQFRLRGTNYREAFQELALELYKTRPDMFRMSTFKNIFLTSEQQLRNMLQESKHTSIEIGLIIELRANGLILMKQGGVISIPKVQESDNK